MGTTCAPGARPTRGRSLALLKALLDRPAAPGHGDQALQRYRSGCVAPVERQSTRGPLVADQGPPVPVRGGFSIDERPVVEAFALGSGPDREALPRRVGGQDRELADGGRATGHVRRSVWAWRGAPPRTRVNRVSLMWRVYVAPSPSSSRSQGNPCRPSVRTVPRGRAPRTGTSAPRSSRRCGRVLGGPARSLVFLLLGCLDVSLRMKTKQVICSITSG